MADTTFTNGATLTEAAWFNDLNDLFYTALGGVAGAGTITKVQFPASQAASADPNALDDYEEGTWTPTDASGAGLALAVAVGTYEKIGRLVIARAAITYPATANGSNADIGGLPFTTANSEAARAGGMIGYTTEATAQTILTAKNGTTFSPTTDAGANVTNATLSGDSLYVTIIFYV
jgi:hypothetical protein